MTLYVWLSIQSDSGITLGEIGKLAADTDSKLVASTLMALKDVVSVEASSGESEFMTGGVETSSFGTFAINVDAETKIVMSYIISVDKGGTVDEVTEERVQLLCNYFGKQLTQLGNLSDHAISGMSLPDNLIMNAFLNAVTIMQLDLGLSTNAKTVKRDYEKIADHLFSDQNDFAETIGNIVNSIKEKDEYWFKGFPIQTARERLLERFAKVIIFRLIDEHPLSILKSPNPKNEFKNVMVYLRKKIKSQISNPQQIIKMKLKELLENNFDEFLESISIRELHTIESIIYKEFVKMSFIETIKDYPWIIFSEPNRSDIREFYIDVVPDYDILHVGNVFTNAIIPEIPQLSSVINQFYTSFIDGMAGLTISEPAIDLMTIFSQTFIETETLIQNIRDIPNLSKEWKREIIELISTDEIINLEVPTIEDAVILTRASINALVDSISLIILMNFIGSSELPALILNKLSESYYKIGPRIRTINILIALLQTISQTNHNVEFVTPIFKDIIGTYIMKNDIKFVANDETWSVSKKLFGPFIANNGSKKVLFVKLLNEIEDIRLEVDQDKIIEINLNNMDIDIASKLIQENDLLLESVNTAIERRIEGFVIEEIKSYQKTINTHFENLISKLKNSSDFENSIRISQSQLPLFQSEVTSYGHILEDLRIKYIDEFKNIINENYYELCLSDVKSTNISSNKDKSKIYKKLNKYAQRTNKIMEEMIDDFRSELYKLGEEMYNSILKKEMIIQEAFKQTETDILRYEKNSNTLQYSPAEAEKIIRSYIDNKFDNYNILINSVKFYVTVNLFKNPPESTYEGIYNRILNNNIDDQIKELLEKSADKKEFELRLREMGRIETKSFFETLSDLISKINNLYIDKNGIVSSESEFLKIHLGKIKLTSYQRRNFLEEFFNISNLVIDRFKDEWLISYGFSRINSKNKMLNVITFSDTMNFIQRLEFHDNYFSVMNGLSDVANMIENEGKQNVFQLFNILKEAIFSEI